MAVMLSPSELDGEVDHSFFDSDSDDGGEDRRKKAEKGLEAEKQSPAAHERSSAKDAGKGGVDLPPRTQSKTRHSKQVELSKKSRTSNVSSVSYTADKTISNSTDGEGELNLHSKRPSGMFLALVADAQELEDVYSQSPKETKVKAFSANSKKWKEQSLRKPVKSQHPHNLSPTSTADSESSRSSWRSNMGSPGLPRPIKFSSHCGVKRTSVSSEESQDLSAASTDESDNTVTNVSPLSSHESGLLQSFNQNHAELKMESHIDQQNEESVTSSGLSNIHQEDDSYQDVDERSFSLESQLDHKLVLDRPRWRNRKNYTFSNDEVWRIDRENQRLLGELSRLSPGPRSGRARRKNTSVASNSPVIRISHSALNRQREQRRIEQENLALLKRLESVKPTPGLKRSEQLADYQRQVGYLGAPSHPVYRSSTRNERTSSRTSSFRSQTS